MSDIRIAKVPARWGIRLDGCQKPLTDLISQHSALLAPDHVYTLIEIGSAGCVTLRAFSDILRELRGDKWRAVGFDLTLDKAWSVNMDEVRQSFVGLPEQILSDDDAAQMLLGERDDIVGMALLLLTEPRSFLANVLPWTVDLAFIDGCHGKCAGLDFLAIEHKVVPGGVVAFHDYGQAEQGEDWQPHCREFINVRTYVHRLGLNQPCNATRKGWRWVGEIPGSRTTGRGDGNSCAVVQRTMEPLETQPELSID